MTKTTTYKNTPIGPIPTEWQVKKLGEVFKISAGGDIKKENVREYHDDTFCYPVYANASKNNGLYGYSNLYKIDKPSLTISGRGEIGIAKARYDKYYPIVRLLVLQPNLNLNLIYIENYINSINLHVESTGVPQLTAPQISKYEIPLPPLPEQQKIAEVLSTWDKAIQETDAIIKKLVDRNKALAFSLLRGKKRVKGFENEWRNTNFGEITEKISRRNKDLINAEVYSVTNSKGFVLQSDHFEGKVAGEDLSNYKVIKKNEFAYNPARINVGSLAYFEDEIGVISSLYVCFKTTEDVLDFYLLQYLQTEYVNSRINALGEGGVRIYLWYELFSKIKISLPSIEEQNAIAEILNTANQEVKQYQQKLEALKLQKKGLMQQLLTGKVRTV